MTQVYKKHIVSERKPAFIFMNAMGLFQAKRVGAIAIIAMLALLILGGNQRQVYADLYPFDDPPSGTDVLCYINGLEEQNGVTIIHPPVPGFNVGECGDASGGEDAEPTPNPACSNNEDDDGDGFTDENDPNCHTDGNPTNSASYNPNKTSEAGSLPVCWNGADDDDDGKTDFPNDPGCSSATDTNEEDVGGDNGEGSAPQCSNGTDDDGDAFVDSADPACHTDFDSSNSGSYDPNLDDESASEPVAPQCSDGVDNDGDALADSADSGCHTDFDAGNVDSYDPSGTNEAAKAPLCSDGLDNDNDGQVDLADGGCENTSDNDETDPPSGGGGGGGGGGGSSRSSTPAPAVLGAATTTPQYSIEEIAACDRYLTAFIKTGQDNDASQVQRLQRFLNDFEGASLEVNGFYGTTTLAAVHAFQTKYSADTLTPWGIGESTGFVYLTTRKKVNEIFCNNTKSFPLTEEQQRLVSEARAGIQATPIAPIVPQAPTAPKQVVSPTVPKSASSTGPAESAFRNVLEFVRGWFGSQQE